MVTISVSDSAWYKYMNTPSNSGLASVPAVTQYLRAAEALDVDYEPLLTQVGIDRKVLTDINKHISSQAMENLLAIINRG